MQVWRGAEGDLPRPGYPPKSTGLSAGRPAVATPCALPVGSLERFLNTRHAESFADTQCPSWPSLRCLHCRPRSSARVLSLSLSQDFGPRLPLPPMSGAAGNGLTSLCAMCCPSHCSLLCSQWGPMHPSDLARERQHSPKPRMAGSRPAAGASGPNSAACWLCGSPSLCRTQLRCERGSSWHPRPDQEGVPQGGQCLAKCSGGSWQGLLLATHLRGMSPRPPPEDWVTWGGGI